MTAQHRDLVSQNQIQNFSKPRISSPYAGSASNHRYADEDVPLAVDQSLGAGVASKDGKVDEGQRGLGTKVVKSREGEGRYHDEEEEEEEGRSWKGVKWCCM